MGRLDYAKVSAKLVGPREWVGTRYYIGQVPQQGNRKLYANQRSFLDSLKKSDGRISIHMGRIEPRASTSQAAQELKHFLATLSTRIDRSVFRQLVQLAHKHDQTVVMVEKAVDVMIAVDMVIMAERDAYDATYLLSADGDFTPACDAVRSHGKKMYAASAAQGAKLAAHVNSFIKLDKYWFEDCYLD